MNNELQIKTVEITLSAQEWTLLRLLRPKTQYSPTRMEYGDVMLLGDKANNCPDEDAKRFSADIIDMVKQSNAHIIVIHKQEEPPTTQE